MVFSHSIFHETCGPKTNTKVFNIYETYMTYIRHILDIYEKRFSLVYTAILACNHVQPN